MKQLSTKTTPWLLLFGRMTLFIVFQAIIAVGFYLGGTPGSWVKAAAWWPFAVTLANLVCIWLMMVFLSAEGGSYWRLFRIDREHVRQDLLILVLLLLVTGPVGYLPNLTLANLLFGSPLEAVNRMLLPLPVLAVWVGMVTFSVTQGLAELPVYFGFVAPRLEKNGLQAWLAVTISAVMLSLQHMAVPLLLDGRYLTWRGLMFLPFAILMGLVLHWRPRLLPYLAVVHILMDASFAAMLLGTAY